MATTINAWACACDFSLVFDGGKVSPCYVLSDPATLVGEWFWADKADCRPVTVELAPNARLGTYDDDHDDDGQPNTNRAPCIWVDLGPVPGTKHNSSVPMDLDQAISAGAARIIEG